MNVGSIPFFQDWSIAKRDHYQTLFPDEILSLIFNSLPVEDLVLKRLVSYQFYCITKQKQQEVNIHLNKACNEIIAYLKTCDYWYPKINPNFNEKFLERLFKFDFTEVYESTVKHVKVYTFRIALKCVPNPNAIFFIESPKEIPNQQRIAYCPGKLSISDQSSFKKELRLIAQNVISIINQNR